MKQVPKIFLKYKLFEENDQLYLMKTISVQIYFGPKLTFISNKRFIKKKNSFLLTSFNFFFIKT